MNAFKNLPASKSSTPTCRDLSSLAATQSRNRDAVGKPVWRPRACSVADMKYLPWLLLVLCLLCPGQVAALTNDDCLGCHGDPELSVTRQGKTISLFVDEEVYKHTVHAENGCVSCHVEAEVDGDEHPSRLASVKCYECHEEADAVYQQSAHGAGALLECGSFVPVCKDCHSTHAIFPSGDKRSTTYPLNLPSTCSKCHRQGAKASEKCHIAENNMPDNYVMSIHGKGLYEDGLVVTAVCTSCHRHHDIQRASVATSSVNRENVLETCNQCHVGIVAKFRKSVHSPLVTKTDKRLPVCVDCHSSHTISRVSQKDFRLTIGEQCGNCHERHTETYFETYHGRASMLWGGEKTAKCSDCHGSHDIMPASDPSSKINSANIVETCAKCHPNSNPSFATYLPHATHGARDKEKYPYLYYTFMAMTGLLVGTFSFFGIHTLMWIPRGIIERLNSMARKRKHRGAGERRE